jgi:hypothetical protein
MKKEKTIYELAQEFPEKSYKQLEKYRVKDREQEAGACIMGEMKKDREELSWQEKYNKEHKLRQEAYRESKRKNENLVKFYQQKIENLKLRLGASEKEKNDMFQKVANALEVNESHQKLNGKLQERLTELEEENKKMHEHLNKQVENARKSGM